ncbi:MAG: ABC transporter substrate-binding protein [Clostridiales bacterium]|nr:ABC transporter substrate-binding protein [Clostridiales bacterium]
MKHRKLPALLLVFSLLFALCACKPAAEDPSDSPSEEASAPAGPSQEPSAEPSEAPGDEQPAIRLAVLSGPTGVGAAKLLDNIDNNSAALQGRGYTYTIETDNSALVAGLSSGEIDIATVASNVAVNLYNKTDGGVEIIAVGTLGVLHILESGGNSSINSLSDLAGKTVYAAGQGANPEYILRYLLQENGLEIGKDVEVVFADASEISAKLLSGEIECAMLPVPAATAAIIKSEGKVRQAVDMTEAWDSLKNGSKLIMTAVVARTEFAEAHPDQVAAFLADYEASIDFVNNNVDAAAELVAGYGITPSAGIAKQAIPQCHLAFISGPDMVASISDYYSVLWSIDPAAVGGSLPDDGIYFLSN